MEFSATNAQYTSPTPTGRNCFVASASACDVTQFTIACADGALSQPHSECTEIIETTIRRRVGGNVGRVSSRHPTICRCLAVWESVVSSPSGVRGGARAEMDFMHI